DSTRRLVVDAALPPAQAANTPLHEAANDILHATEDSAESTTHRGLKQPEAEPLAYVVAGIPGPAYLAYSTEHVAGWSQGEAETIKETAARVLRAAHTLAEVITESDEAREAA